MSSTTGEPQQIAQDFDESACDFCEKYEKIGLSKSSRILLDFISEEGVKGKTLLDLGCGAGGFSVETLKKGAASSVGVDLSSKMVETANRLAASNGFAAQAKFTVGNAATASLPESDIVVLDKVICCYSEIGPLVRNAAGGSGRLLGFVVPRSEGIAKWLMRCGVWILNRWEKRRGGILFYLHPLDVLDRTLGELGFERQKKKAARFWLVFLYKRTRQ